MISVKTAVSIPDDVFEEADREARRLGVSRSELITRALRAMLGAERSRRVTASYDEAFGVDAEDPRDGLRRDAARRLLLDVEW